MSEGYRKHVPLTVRQILELAEIVDVQRKLINQMIEDNPAASEDNEKRRRYITHLDELTMILVAQIG